MIRFVVPGAPVPQGSMSAFNDDDGRARVRHSKPKGLDRYRADVRNAAAHVEGAGIIEGPIYVEASFVIERPKNHWRANGELKDWAPTFHTGARPDADKLLRALLDALTGVLFRDDGHVAVAHIEKRYVGETEAPHTEVIVDRLEDGRSE